LSAGEWNRREEDRQSDDRGCCQQRCSHEAIVAQTLAVATVAELSLVFSMRDTNSRGATLLERECRWGGRIC
jgi:hypothetical protein